MFRTFENSKIIVSQSQLDRNSEGGIRWQKKAFAKQEAAIVSMFERYKYVCRLKCWADRAEPCLESGDTNLLWSIVIYAINQSRVGFTWDRGKPRDLVVYSCERTVVICLYVWVLILPYYVVGLLCLCFDDEKMWSTIVLEFRWD